MRVAMGMAVVVAAGCGRVGFGEISPDTSDGRMVDAAWLADATPAVDATAVVCSPEFGGMKGSDHRYLFDTTSRTWADAQAHCASYGPGHKMVVVDDNAEREGLKDQHELLVPGISWWVDGTDVVVVDDWRTADNIVMTYLPWAETEPDGGDYCLGMLPSNMGPTRDGLFNDIACASSHPSVCECAGQ